jgi:hypothetical protein
MRYIIIKLKKIIDKLYYSKYYSSREILIREIFPGTYNVWEYKHLSKYLNSNDANAIDNLIKVIWDYYWWEVSRLGMEGKFTSIERVQWLLDFAQSLKDYKLMLLTEAEDNKI